MIALAAVLVLTVSSATPALAEEGSQYGPIGQYGEVTRFGGFDSTWYDGGQDDGKGGSPNETEPKPGLFLDPVGFAVDSSDTGVPSEDKSEPAGDDNAIWVLDRTGETNTQSSWRLQKLDDLGKVLGSTSFTLSYSEGSPSLVEGLAVDQATKKIYTLVVNHQESSSIAVAQEILDWSIEPSKTETNDSGVKKLVAPTGAKLDALTVAAGGNSQPGVLAEEATLAGTASTSLGSELYDPQGIAVDDVTGGGQYIAIEATTNASPAERDRGPVVVQQVSQANGALGSYWDSVTGLSGGGADTLNDLANACTGLKKPVKWCEGEENGYGPAGLASDPVEGGLTVLLQPDGPSGGEELPYNTDVVKLNAELGSPMILSSEPLSQEGPRNYDGAAIEGYEVPFTRTALSGKEQLEPAASVTALSNGLYVTTFYNSYGENTYWTGPRLGSGPVNLGLRLLDPERESGDTLSNPQEPLTSVFDTLGQSTGEAANQPIPVPTASACNINAIASAVAGADGAVWVLTRGIDSTNDESVAGRQVIEFAPNKGTACPSPSGTFTIEGHPASTTTPVAVPVGATAQFSASSIALEHGTPYTYQWSPTGEAFTGPNVITNTMATETYASPTATASYTYTEPGIFSVKLRLLGDYGEYEVSGLVAVQTTEKPTAAFNVSPTSTQTHAPVSLDASESKAAAGTRVIDYIWNFGDGGHDETQSTSDTHSYAAVGTYTVGLKVRDNDGQESAEVMHAVTVNPPEAHKAELIKLPEVIKEVPIAKVDRSPTDMSPSTIADGTMVKVSLSCPSTKTLCAGTVELRTASAVAASRQKKAKKKVLTLGHSSFNLEPGEKTTLSIKLSSGGLGLLKRIKSLKVAVLVAAHDAYGDPSSKTLTLTLHSPKAGKKHHR